MAKRSILPYRLLKGPQIDKNTSKNYVKSVEYTYPQSTAPMITPNPSLKDNWPPKLKEIEFLLKYPAEKEEPPMPKVPTDWKDTVSEIGDPTVTQPAKKPSMTSSMTTIPSKKATYSVGMTTIPGKAAKKDYDYPSFSIEGEDGKLAKIFKSIPKD
jgi:hypothetical protein